MDDMIAWMQEGGQVSSFVTIIFSLVLLTNLLFKIPFKCRLEYLMQLTVAGVDGIC